jgi:hypothetical protein
MKKDILIGLAVLALGVSGVVLYAAMRPLPAKAPPAIDLSGLSGNSLVEHGDYYDIAVNYASSTPLLGKVGPAADAEAAALMKKFVDDAVAQFKTDGRFDRLTPNDIRMMGLDKDRKEKLQIVYLVAVSYNTISYIYTIYSDTLGAHGNTFFRTFTFDMTNGKLVTLGDAFTSGSNYLATLSQMSRDRLPKVIGDNAVASMITSGTTPEEKNFTNFFLDNQDFVILFAPYAVAPYSSGTQTLRIPLSELSSILKPEYR